MMKQERIFRFSVRIVTPVHIGCDEVYEPTAFVVDQERRCLVSFDSLDFFKSLNGQEKVAFKEICCKGTVESLIEIYRFMSRKKFAGKDVDVSKGFLDLYNETLHLSPLDSRRLQQEINKFSIARTAFNPLTGMPYIPGSSLKGAFRTAYLNRLADQKPVINDRSSRELEKRLLDGGAFATDPFRMLKISDFIPRDSVRTRIIFAVNEKKGSSSYQARGPYQILEVIEPGAVFEGTVLIDEPVGKAGIQTPLTPNSLFGSAAGFYSGEYRREADELRTIGIRPPEINISEKSYPLRIGRHSGAESVTIGKYRNIKIMKGRGQRNDFLDSATTFWLASGEPKPAEKSRLLPFGWIAVDSPDSVFTAVPQGRRRIVTASQPQQKTAQGSPKSARKEKADLSGLRKKFKVTRKKP